MPKHWTLHNYHDKKYDQVPTLSWKMLTAELHFMLRPGRDTLILSRWLEKNKMTNMSRESASKPTTTKRWKDICKNLDEWVSSLIWPGPSFEWSWREQCWWWQSKCFALSLLAGWLHPLHHYHYQVGHILFSLFNVIWKTDGSTKTS